MNRLDPSQKLVLPSNKEFFYAGVHDSLHPGLAHTSWLKIRQHIRERSMILIDLRSPKEYHHAHIPHAINIPLLDNNERHQVGLLYKKAGPHEAVALGLTLFAKKASAFMEFFLDRSLNDKPFVIYCWRGGMRSRLVATLLQSIKLRPLLLKGGYKQYRKAVLTELDQLAKHPKLVLNGRTGSGKTDILLALQKEGRGAIDLEGLACHRGSAFGGIAQKFPPPSQQQFENALAEQYLICKHHPRILFELENFIGPIRVPLKIRQSLCTSPMIFVSREFDDRINRLTETYSQGWNRESIRTFHEKLGYLSKYLSNSQKNAIIAAVNRYDLRYVVEQLLLLRYDKTYDKSLDRHASQAIGQFNLTREKNEAMVFLRKNLPTTMTCHQD